MPARRPETMDPAAIAAAARMLSAPRRGGPLAERLPIACRPTDADEAELVQRAIAACLGEEIAGWKVAFNEAREILRGAVLASRTFAGGATVESSLVPTLSLEAEIAFRCETDLPPRAAPYHRAEVEAAVTALPAIEIVDSRFREGTAIPVIERAADFMSNGALIVGMPREDWRAFDLISIPASLYINGTAVVNRAVGGLVPKDPVLPLLGLVNVLRERDGVVPGQIVTTGTYTGVVQGVAGDRVEAVFEGFGAVSVTLL